MRYHYIYFILFPILMFVAMMTPMIDWGFGPQSMLDLGIGFVILVPTLIATILLLIRNHVTALIGLIFYGLVMLYSGLQLLSYITLAVFTDAIGPAPYMVFGLTIAAVTISIIHTVKLFKRLDKKAKKIGRSDILDD